MFIGLKPEFDVNAATIGRMYDNNNEGALVFKKCSEFDGSIESSQLKRAPIMSHNP